MSPPIFSEASLARHRSPHQGEPLSPGDRLLVAQTVLLIGISSWGGGGWLPGVLPAMLAVAGIGLVALWLRHREHQPINLWAFLPVGLWVGFAAVSVLNPSHVQGTSGAFFPRHGWISWLPATVSPAATVQAQLPWLVALLQGATLVAARPRRRAARYIWTFAALNAFALAAIGAAFHFAETDRMIGLFDTTQRYFFATFFYKNHWAAYGWLGAMVGAALAVQAARRSRSGDPRASAQAFFFGATALLTAITLPLPGSRSGAAFAFLFVAILPVTLLWQLRPQAAGWTRSQVAAAVLALTVVLGSVAYGVNAYAGRAREDWERTERQVAASRNGESPEVRLLVSRDTWKMALARPWFGWGVGSYELAFPLYQGAYLRDARGQPTARFEFAHDDWLQLFAEAGLVGLAVLLVPLGRMVRCGWRDGGPAARIALSGCGVLALYAWIDFPFNNPAVLTLWIIIVSTAERVDPRPTARSPVKPTV